MSSAHLYPPPRHPQAKFRLTLYYFETHFIVAAHRFGCYCFVMPSKRWIIHTRPHRGPQACRNAPPKAFDSDAATQSPQWVPMPNAPPAHAHSPAIYHCVNRVVDRRFVFGPREKDKFVEFMRMYEDFTGIRILAFCVMSNHFHLLIENTRMRDGGLSDAELLNRLAAIYDEATVEAVELELLNARHAISEGRASERRAEEIHERYTYRMHDLSEFMKSLVQRFTQWYNRRNERKGNLWEDAFRSTVVEPGIAARMVATYIDLNPVRAGIVNDPEDYSWCSYGEATAGLKQRKKPTSSHLRARAGLVRAFFAHAGVEPDARRWQDCQKIQRPWIEQAMERVRASHQGKPPSPNEVDAPGNALAGRIRHFTDGVAIGSRGFIDMFFQEKRDRFGSKRTSGARPIRGANGGIARREGIYCIRDLQKHLES